MQDDGGFSEIEDSSSSSSDDSDVEDESDVKNDANGVDVDVENGRRKSSARGETKKLVWNSKSKLFEPHPDQEGVATYLMRKYSIKKQKFVILNTKLVFACLSDSQSQTGNNIFILVEILC